jgi:hypothetical protein
MEDTHIKSILSGLKNNMVTIPIVSNGYMELEGTPYKNMQSVDSDNFFSLLDDMLGEFRRGKPIYQKQKQNISSTPSTSNLRGEVKSLSPFMSLVFSLACVRRPSLSLKYRKNDVEEAVVDFMKFMKQALHDAQVKAVDLAKYKLTKKQMQQYLDTCLVQAPETVEPIIILFCKLIGFNIVIVDDAKKHVIQTFDVCLPLEQTRIGLLSTSGTSGAPSLVSATFQFCEVMEYEEFINKMHKVKLDEYKSESGFKENLKSLSVKDLRKIAIDIGICVDDKSTGKLFVKKDLLKLIEVQL